MMQNKKIAVTGGLGSGKSTLLRILREKDFPVFSCDEIYAELSAEQEFLEKLAAIFPDCVVDGLDRKALAKKVFSDEAALEKLNALTHPLIMDRLKEHMGQYPLSFAEVPLLFEGGYEKLFDGVIVVLREKSKRIEAVKARSGLTEEEILLRMARQYNYDAVPKNCYILYNNGSVDELEQAAEKILSEII